LRGWWEHGMNNLEMIGSNGLIGSIK